MSSIDEAITLLVERRWPMIPSTGANKSPCVSWKKFQRELPTVDELRRWHCTFTPERWGLVTGQLAGIVVVDFDGDLGRTLMEEWDIVPHVRTGSGGFHWYAIHPGWFVPTLNAKSGKKSWPWPGVDIRGDGGFAVVLGRNANGPYEQLRELEPEPFDLLPAEVATYLHNHGTKNAPSSLQAIVPCRTIDKRPDGVDFQLLIGKGLNIAAASGRNNAGFWLACQLRDNDYGLTDATAAMRAYRSRVSSTNTKGLFEPYTENEMMASLREAYSRPARSHWGPHKSHPHDDQRLKTAVSPKPDLLENEGSLDCKEKLDQQGIADNSENLYLYVGHPGEPLVEHRSEPLSRKGFSRIPDEVSRDPRLRHRDVSVYGALASAFRSSSVSVGKRRLAMLARCAERLVIESLKRLEAAGHIRKNPRKRGQRAEYVLLSPVFQQKDSTLPSNSGSGDQINAPTLCKRQPMKVISWPRRTGQR